MSSFILTFVVISLVVLLVGIALYQLTSSDTLAILAILVGGFALFVCTIVLIADHAQRDQCSRTARLTGLQTLYVDSNSGCYVKVDDQWTPYDRWTNVSGTSNQ